MAGVMSLVDSSAWFLEAICPQVLGLEAAVAEMGVCFEAPGPKHQFLAMATIQAPAPYLTSPMEWASKSSGRTLPGFCFHKPQALCDFQPQAGLCPQIPESVLSL